MCHSESVIVHYRSISEILVEPGVNAAAKSGILEKVDALGGTGGKRKLAESAGVEETKTNKSRALCRSSPSVVFTPECVDNSREDSTNNALLAAEESFHGVGGNSAETREMMSSRSWSQHEQSMPLAEDWLLFARSLSRDGNEAEASDGRNIRLETEKRN